jgi:hypothetical protein
MALKLGEYREGKIIVQSGKGVILAKVLGIC